MLKYTSSFNVISCLMSSTILFKIINLCSVVLWELHEIYTEGLLSNMTAWKSYWLRFTDGPLSNLTIGDLTELYLLMGLWRSDRMRFTDGIVKHGISRSYWLKFIDGPLSYMTVGNSNKWDSWKTLILEGFDL